MSFNNEEAKDGQSIVNIMFKEYFSSVYKQPQPNPNFTHNVPNSIPTKYLQHWHFYN